MLLKFKLNDDDKFQFESVFFKTYEVVTVVLDHNCTMHDARLPFCRVNSISEALQSFKGVCFWLCRHEHDYWDATIHIPKVGLRPILKAVAG